MKRSLTILFFVFAIIANNSKTFAQNNDDLQIMAAVDISAHSIDADDNYTKFELFYDKGREYFDEEDYLNALPYFLEAYSYNPIFTSSLALTCHHLNLYNRAIMYLKDALYDNPNLQNKGNLAAFYSEIGENSLALEYLDEVLQCNPQYMYALNNKAAIFMEQGNLDQALELLNEASLLELESESSFAVVFCNIGEVYQLKEASDSAVYYFDKALEIDPDLSQATILKIKELVKRGKSECEYKQLCISLIESESSIIKKNKVSYKSYFNRASAYKYLGNEVQMTEDLNEALTILDQLISLYPKSNTFLKMRAEMYAMLGNEQQAAADFEQLLKINPGNLTALKYLNKIK